MIYLTKDDVLLGNEFVVNSGIFSDAGLPEANINFLDDNIDDIIYTAIAEPLMPAWDLPAIAAIYLNLIILSETFRCGKCRIALFAVILFLRKNRHQLMDSVSEEDLFFISFEIVERRFGREYVSKWISERIVPDWYGPLSTGFPIIPSLN